MSGRAKVKDRHYDEWELEPAGENSTGVYYTVAVDGGRGVPVTVKHNIQHQRMSCLTCMTADICDHARFARRKLAL